LQIPTNGGFHDFKPNREKLVYTMNPQDIFDLLDEILYVYSQPVMEDVEA
jgi:hypothetical protein